MCRNSRSNAAPTRNAMDFFGVASLVPSAWPTELGCAGTSRRPELLAPWIFIGMSPSRSGEGPDHRHGADNVRRSRPRTRRMGALVRSVNGLDYRKHALMPRGAASNWAAKLRVTWNARRPFANLHRRTCEPCSRPRQNFAG